MCMYMRMNIYIYILILKRTTVSDAKSINPGRMRKSL